MASLVLESRSPRNHNRKKSISNHKSGKMSPHLENRIGLRLLDILKHHDLHHLTYKQVRSKLENEFKVDLNTKEWKKTIREAITNFVETSTGVMSKYKNNNNNDNNGTGNIDLKTNMWSIRYNNGTGNDSGNGEEYWSLDDDNDELLLYSENELDESASTNGNSILGVNSDETSTLNNNNSNGTFVVNSNSNNDNNIINNNIDDNKYDVNDDELDTSISSEHNEEKLYSPKRPILNDTQLIDYKPQYNIINNNNNNDNNILNIIDTHSVNIERTSKPPINYHCHVCHINGEHWPQDCPTISRFKKAFKNIHKNNQQISNKFKLKRIKICWRKNKNYIINDGTYSTKITRKTNKCLNGKNIFESTYKMCKDKLYTFTFYLNNVTPNNNDIEFGVYNGVFSWSFQNGYKTICNDMNGKKCREYGNLNQISFQNGDQLEMHVDCKHYTIQYILNGVDLGIAFKNFNKSIPYEGFYLFLKLNNKNSCVTLSESCESYNDINNINDNIEEKINEKNRELITKLVDENEKLLKSNNDIKNQLNQLQNNYNEMERELKKYKGTKSFIKNLNMDELCQMESNICDVLNNYKTIIKDKNDNEYNCPICFDNKKNVVIIPCGHFICNVCQKKLDKCPLCRGKMKQIITLK